MKIAISAEGENIVSHLEKPSFFIIADIMDGHVLGRKIVKPPCPNINIPLYLNFKNINCIITKSIGERAGILFKSLGIKMVITDKTKVNDVIEDLEMRNRL